MAIERIDLLHSGPWGPTDERGAPLAGTVEPIAIAYSLDGVVNHPAAIVLDQRLPWPPQGVQILNGTTRDVGMSFGRLQNRDLQNGSYDLFIPSGGFLTHPWPSPDNLQQHIAYILNAPTFTPEGGTVHFTIYADRVDVQAGTSGASNISVSTDFGLVGTGINPPTGGTSMLGFTSGIYRALENAIPIIAAAGTNTTPGTPQTFTYLNPAANYVQVVINCTAVGAASSFTVTINGVDPASGTAYPILASTSISGTGYYVMRVGPGLTPAPNAVANDMLPQSLQFVVTPTGANACTYSIGASFNA